MKISYVSLGGISTDLDGTVTYDFDGHIHAEGIDFTFDPTPVPPAEDAISWTRRSDGFLAGLLAAGQFGLTPEVRLESGAEDVRLLGADGSSSFIQAHGVGGKYLLSAAEIDTTGALLIGVGGIASSARLGPGRYRYTFLEPASVRFLMAMPLVGAGAVTVEQVASTSSTIDLLFFTSHTATAVDTSHQILWLELP